MNGARATSPPFRDHHAGTQTPAELDAAESAADDVWTLGTFDAPAPLSFDARQRRPLTVSRGFM